MQITETASKDLHREFKIVIGAKDLDERLTGRIAEIQPQVHLKGFRPGKAPVSFLKKTYGKSMMNEIVEAAVQESIQKAVSDNSLKPAYPPRPDEFSNLEEVVDGKADLEFTVKVDLMPDFETADPAQIKAERLVADVTDEAVDNAIANLAEQTRGYSNRPEGEGAEKDDQVVIDFVGSVEGEEFEGGKADGFNLKLGSNQLIPGFEDQLIGAKAGERHDVKVTFPESYGAPNLAGKDAAFAVTVKEVKKPDELRIDDELAKRLGLDSLATLRSRIYDQLRNEYSRAGRLHLKRHILDALDEMHSFPLPPSMVENEFTAIWREVQNELAREGKTPEDEGKSEEELRKEYHDIAERRVKLGLVLARIGEQNGIQVSSEEINQALMARARQFPGQEQQVYQYYTENPQAQAEIRAPIFEEKVVDFIAELADVTDRTVSREILFMDPDDAMEKLRGDEPDKPKGKKKAAKAGGEKDAEAADAEKKPAKKKAAVKKGEK